MVLDNLGFSLNHPDTQKRYYVMNAGDSNVEDDLNKAFMQGSIVVIEELNTNPKLKALLNQLLIGKNLQNQDPDKKGFMVLASQNASTEPGCEVITAEQLNRFNVMYMEPYSVDAMIEMATFANVPEPADFVRGFVRCKEENSDTSMRHFQKLIQHFSTKSDISDDEIIEPPQKKRRIANSIFAVPSTNDNYLSSRTHKRCGIQRLS